MQASIRDALFVQMQCDFEQALIGKAEQRRAQRRGEFDRILRIVDRGQERGQVVDFLAVVKAAPLDGIAGHAGPHEGVLVDRDVAERAQQQRDIGELHRTRRAHARIDHGSLLTDYPRAAPRDRVRLDPAKGTRAALCAVGVLRLKTHDQLDGGRVARGPDRFQPMLVAPFDLVRLVIWMVGGAHRVRAYRVDEINDRRKRAAVLTQRPRQDRERRARPVEDRDVCAAEAIDRLLFVAHHKKLRRGRAVLGEKAHNAVLDRVSVLAFVEQQCAERAPVAVRDFRMAAQQAVCEDQQIVEGDDAFVALAPFELGGDIRDQRGDLERRRRRAIRAI